MVKAVFLDRDGTLNEEVNYLHECDKLKLIGGTEEALKILKDKGYILVVVTNQSGVGRGYYPIEDVYAVNNHMKELLKSSGVLIDGFYCCPHTEADKCKCRKPGTGLYLKAAKDFSIDFKSSYMVGDKESDIQAAEKLGCGYALVRTGHTIKSETEKKYEGHVYDNLLEFAESL